MISTSISAAAAQAHVNDLLADAHRNNQVRLARQANAGRRIRHRQHKLRLDRASVSWPERRASVWSALRTHRPGGLSRTAAISTVGEGDA